MKEYSGANVGELFSDEIANSPDAEEQEMEMEPGDCIGNYLEGDVACQVCEIQEDCREITEAEKSLKEENARN